MCLAIPMRLMARRDEFVGVVEAEGAQREVSLALHPEAQVGDWLLIHAGYAIGAVDEEEARLTLDLLKEVVAAEERQ